MSSSTLVRFKILLKPGLAGVWEFLRTGGVSGVTIGAEFGARVIVDWDGVFAASDVIFVRLVTGVDSESDSGSDSESNMGF